MDRLAGRRRGAITLVAVPELLRIFIDVLLPVFGVAGAGYAAARIAKLDHRALGTLAYWLLAPAFIFSVLSDPAALDGPVIQMLASSFVSVSIVWIIVWMVLRREPGERRVIDAMSSAMGNVGNLGFPVVLFALGDAALAAAAVHFLAVTTCMFGFGVTASARLRSGNALTALRRVVTTPAILAVPAAFIMAASESSLPTAPDRFIGLLADAMIPVMLLTLGIQLSSSRLAAGWRRLGFITVSKLIISPLVFLAVAAVIGLDGVARDAGLVLAAMPTAVLVGLIGLEFDLETEVASAAILITSILSMGSLSVVLALV
jgi:predicted permease